MKREKIYNYFYIVNNLLNGHFYLGVHSTDTLADGYFGSGLALKKAIKSYGKEHFELTPLKFFKTRKELMDFEREIVNERFLTYYKGICYNLKKGGEGGCEKKFSDEELKEHGYKAILEWRENNREQYLGNLQKWRNNNPEYQREWDKNNRERKRKSVRDAARRYRENHPEHKEYMSRWYQQKKAAKLASQSTPGS